MDSLCPTSRFYNVHFNNHKVPLPIVNHGCIMASGKCSLSDNHNIDDTVESTHTQIWRSLTVNALASNHSTRQCFGLLLTMLSCNAIQSYILSRIVCYTQSECRCIGRWSVVKNVFRFLFLNLVALFTLYGYNIKFEKCSY